MNGSALMDVGHPKRTFWHVPLTKRVFVSANPQRNSLLGSEKVSVGYAGKFVLGSCGVLSVFAVGLCMRVRGLAV